MYVPNYIPEAIEIEGNVSDAKWTVQLQFLRKLSAIVVGLIAIVFILTSVQSHFFSPSPASLLYILASLVASLAMLSFARTFLKRSRWELFASLPLFAICLNRIVELNCLLPQIGWPIESAATGIVYASVYSFCCGRDFSFIGQWALSLIASSIYLAIFAIQHHWIALIAARGLAINFIFLTYYSYDTTRLMRRRTAEEPWLAAIDLFRDVFNFFGYSIRCWQHWKKHRIFITPNWMRGPEDNG